MKPSFALDFRDGLIALLHRTSRGWQQVGASPLDAPDLSEALSYLRSTALGLSPRGISTKLVLPNDQILYTRVHAPGPDAARRKRQIKAALEGLTPYPVDDLAYDWWGTGPEIHVAVIAKETLAEAEAFAAEHRFNPVSFVAAPDDGSFTGEPFFGQTALAATLLADGEKVERDQDPVSSTAREFQRHDTAPEPEPMAQAAPLAEAAKPDLPPAAPAVAAPEAAAAPMQHDEAAPVPNTAEAAAPADLAGLPDFSQVVAPAAGSPPFDPFAVEAALVEEAPMALDVIDPDTFPPA